MDVFLIGLAFIVSLFSLFATIAIGNSQEDTPRGKYDSQTKQNVIRLVLIYSIAFLLAILGLIFYLLIQ